MTIAMTQRLNALTMARQCVEFGGRVATVEHLTGLSSADFHHLAFASKHASPRGRAPNSVDWLHRRTTLLDQASAALIMSVYRRLRTGGFMPADALLGAYGQYRSICAPPYRISLDRALDLASNLDGIWLSTVRTLDVIRCPACGSDRLTYLGADARLATGCPFCVLLQRYRIDQYLQALFPVRPLPDASCIELSVMALMRTQRSAPSSEGDLRCSHG